MIDTSIFKSNDIRGIYPSQLDKETAYRIGRSFVKHTGAKKVIVGYDTRLSSKELFEELSRGIVSQGADVFNIGLAPTELVYFAVGNYDFEAGVMVTASHNPKKYNGFKMLVKKDGGIEMVRGRDLLELIGKNDFPKTKNGQIHEKSILGDYLHYIDKFKGDISPFKIAVDVSNGAVGAVMENLAKKLPVQLVKINFEPDGNFPNHSPNPLEKGSLNQISKVIIEKRADFGFIFDADGDRVFLVDEKGELASADLTLLLLVKYFLGEEPGAVITYNAICSKAVPEFIEKWGGKAIRAKVGFVNVREALMENNGLMGGELSGHYSFKDYFYMDSGIAAFLILLQVISQDGRKISEIIKEVSIYYKSAELNFQIENKEAVLEKIRQKYSDGKQDFLDGVTVEYKDWWFNVRPSNTEPLLRLTVEANTKELLEEKKQELTRFIDSL